MDFDIMDLLNSPFLDKIGTWMDKNNMFYVPVRIGWKFIKKLLGFKSKFHDIYMIGQSHLDACWTWTWRETVVKNYKTFSNALRHIKDYPFFTFSCSSPQYFFWMERYFPDKFEEIKKRVKQGRIELVGGMWIEPDINLINGESLARQRLYGQRYYLKKFGEISKIGWLSDTFGYCWTLPQVLKKSGSEYFYTNKMQWNDTNSWPFVVFFWQSPDGSKVLTYTYSYTVNLLYQEPTLGDFTEASRFLTEKNQTFNYDDGFEKIEKLKGKHPLREFGFVYGIGDGGGGPIRSEIIFFKELFRKGEVKKFVTMGQYFDILKKYKDHIPIWNDEMYLEDHRGCYTSHAWLKVANRNSEQLLYKTDMLASIASIINWEYPRKRIENLYKRLLFNQFHDILPGSAIPEVYEDTRHDFEVINAGCKGLMDKSLRAIMKNLDLSGDLLVFNPLNWARKDIIELEKDGLFIIKDKSDNIIPYQKIKDNKIIFISSEIPAIGFNEYKYEEVSEVPEIQSDLVIDDTDNELKIENIFIRAVLNKKDGNLKSIYHKKLKREILSGKGNEVQIFKEKFGPVGFFAWNLDKNYHNHPLEVKFESLNVLEKGPIRLVVEVNKSRNRSKIRQLIILYRNIDRIDFKIELEFYEGWNLVKVAFPLDIETKTVNCEIPFGVIPRATKPNNPSQKGKFEIASQRWLDLSEESFGVSMLNRTRYGFDVRYDEDLKNILRMTILRVPKYPSSGSPITSIIPSKEFHKQTKFSVDYSLSIHKGDWITNESHRKGIEFNVPVITREIEKVSKSNSVLHVPTSIITIEPSNIILSTLKQCEDDNSIILRIFETTGSEAEVKIKLNDQFQINKAEEVDILELNPKPIESFSENKISLTIKKFEIKTIKIDLIRGENQ
ncbi:MAG: hypothetical protein GF329_11415 [Candidatus Lokiarchaeota archaeon]|nr:hypothetical protein [Candidatus Lokiarchaeota archaeon]